MQQPLISIVIANYNYGRFIGDAIQSVLSQKADEIELIVVDGNSTDNSIDVVKSFAGNEIECQHTSDAKGEHDWHICQHLTWISEKDHGQSDAFNKGFGFAHGKYLTWLNADDILINGAAMAIVTFFHQHPSENWLSGGTVFFNEHGIQKMRIGMTIPKFLQRYVTILIVGGPSTIFSKELWMRANYIDESLHYVMDIDLWYKFQNLKAKLVHVPNYIWGFRVHAESKTSSMLVNNTVCSKHQAERDLLNKRYPESALTNWLKMRVWFVLKLISGSFLKSIIDTKRYANRDVALISNNC